MTTRTRAIAAHRALRFRAIFISDTHLGTPGCQAARAARLPALHGIGLPVPRRRHHRRLAAASAAGTGTSRTTTSCRRCCARRARARGSSTSRATTTRRRATTSASTSAASPSATRRCTSRAPARASSSRTATASTRVVTCAKWLALLGDRLYTLTLKLNQHFNALRARMGLPYWSLSRFLKLRVKNAVALHRRIRGRAGARGAHARLRRRRLRPHPSRGGPVDRRRAVLQLGRLGREPDRAGRGGRRHAVDRCAGTSGRQRCRAADARTVATPAAVAAGA